MTIGKSGYIDIDAGGGVRFWWREEYDVAGNYSVINIYQVAVNPVTSTRNGTWRVPFGLNIDGTRHIEMTVDVPGCVYNSFVPYAIECKSNPIYHDAKTGAASVTIGVVLVDYLSCLGIQWDGGKGYTNSVTVALTTIPRLSELSAANGTLGTAQTLTVTQKTTAYTHTITYACGSASGTICEKSSSTSISWTPPISLASQNTTGTSVSVTLTIATYNGDTLVGTKNTTILCAIPSSVKPSVSMTITDANGYADTYGGYVQRRSRFKVVLEITTAYGSEIATSTVTTDGQSYNGTDITTAIIQNSGNLIINATVKDKRGRSATASETVTVLAYSPPAITAVNYNRADADGTDNPVGEYAEVVMSASVTSLDSKNTATYTLQYKQSTETEYTSVDMTEYDNVYALSNATKMFAADAGHSYNVIFTVSDAFSSVKTEFNIQTGEVLMHRRAKGIGLGIGMICEEDYAVHIAWDTTIHGNLFVHGKSVVPGVVNFIDNGYFAKIVNQDGQTSYKGAGDAFDRWELSSVAWMVTVDDGYITVSDNPDSTSTATGMLRQYIPVDASNRGKTVTLAAKVKGIDVRLNINNAVTSSYNKDDSDWVTLRITGTIPTDADTFFVALQSRNQTTYNCEWIALYEGEYTVDTLPPYTAKGYGVELVECLRYYVNFTDAYFRSYVQPDSNLSNVQIVFPVPMRITPTVTYEFSSGATVYGTNMSPYVANIYSEEGIILKNVKADARL